MGSPFFRTRSAPKAKCAWGVMDFVSEFSLQDDDSGYSSERVLSLSETISGTCLSRRVVTIWVAESI